MISSTRSMIPRSCRVCRVPKPDTLAGKIRQAARLTLRVWSFYSFLLLSLSLSLSLFLSLKTCTDKHMLCVHTRAIPLLAKKRAISRYPEKSCPVHLAFTSLARYTIHGASPGLPFRFSFLITCNANSNHFPRDRRAYPLFVCGETLCSCEW